MSLDMQKYKKVRAAQGQGARTIEELKNLSDIAIEDDAERKEIEEVLKNACRCRNVSIEEVVKAVNNGADTLEKVGEATGAGTVCGRCKGLLENIIENKR
ncbi:(2Fe-2S)-binding protein [Alloiococcus sp. CFN-8]|uniref:(2Fe-2S)-binding protein n=1 Tax=Alloiococcus sp. CFN-8 TaxID=3416081 RepID=UPI003CFB3263